MLKKHIPPPFLLKMKMYWRKTKGKIITFYNLRFKKESLCYVNTECFTYTSFFTLDKIMHRYLTVISTVVLNRESMF